MFVRLFALTPREAEAMPHTVKRRPLGGVYYLYGEEAVERVLADGGFDQWRRRLASRPAPRWRPKPVHWRGEERLHARASRLVM